jgi:hypothetical protein
MDRAGSGGWWLASDGRWYPPQPSANPATQPIGQHIGSRALITVCLIVAMIAGLALLVDVSRTSTATAPTAVVAPANPGHILLARAVRDAGLQGWAHIELSTTHDSTAVVITGDAGPNEGQQTLTEGAQSATVIYVDRVAYVRATSASLAQSTLGDAVSGTAAVGRWVSVTSSDRDYAAVSGGLTLSSALGQLLDWPNQLAMGRPTTVDGQQVVPITGEVRLSGGGPTVRATLDVTRTARPLPLEMNATSAATSETVIFSHWGDPVTITAPSGAQPVTSLKG